MEITKSKHGSETSGLHSIEEGQDSTPFAEGIGFPICDVQI